MHLAVGEFIETYDENTCGTSEYERVLFGIGDATADDIVSLEKPDKVHRIVRDFHREEFAVGKKFCVEVKDVDDVGEYYFARFDTGYDGDGSDGGGEVGI